MSRTIGKLLLIFAAGVLANYPWELAQSPLYAGMGEVRANLWHCFVSSLGDGVLVLLIFSVGAMTFRRFDWYERPGAPGYFVMLAAGLVIAVGVEWFGVHVLERWMYTIRMPRIPGLDIGVVPVAQMLVLPPLVFRVVAGAYSARR